MRFRIDLKIFLFIILFYFTKQLELYALIMIFAILHELGHLFAGLLTGMRPEKLEIKPYGVAILFKLFPKDYNTKIGSGNKLEIKKIFIALAGPIANLLLIFIFANMPIEERIKQLIIYSNILLILFNLIPIYPLDGSRIVGILLQGIMDLQRALYLQLKLSVLMLCVVLIFSLRISSVFIFMYLFYEQFLFLKMIPTILRKCFICLDEGKEVILHHNYTYRRGKKNYYMSNGKIYDAFHFYKMLLKSIK